MDKMFGIMMPRGSKKLQLSKMNMMGIGGRMIRKVMKNKNISFDSKTELQISQLIECENKIINKITKVVKSNNNLFA
jgi:peroxiredoxin family protein